MEPNAASAALLDGGRVLLIQRAFEPFAGLWTLPGGRRDAGESIEETARREVREELGLVAGALRPVLTMGIGSDFRLKVFATQEFSGEITPSAEIAGHRWIEAVAIAELPTTPQLDVVLARAFSLFGRH